MRIGHRLRTLFLAGMLLLAAGWPTAAAADAGLVTSSPSGVSCPTTCSAVFDYGTEIVLTETPASGWIFTGWGGACSGSASTCTLIVDSTLNLSASFTDSLSLSVSVIGTSGGTVTSSPAGINCGSTCSANFPIGTQVTLTASPAATWGFSGWGGACSGIANSCTVTTNASTNASATFSTLFSVEAPPVVTSDPAVLPAVISSIPQPQ
jgi:hypothetical protein